ncbi:Ctl1p [Saccharomyces cerevisiae YJM248]|nr:Ctl1p [Saccharomyces cerevisiae YJM248]CAI4687953.1 AIE_G0042070.mRNA.1.CDS.1 [Saccharomyces cerevisiae]CAI6842079.1 AIE_G0042070.mRNA.1.CDS.1 [Saccharomyces cerevisiae]
MPDQPETSFSSRNSHEDVSTKKINTDVVPRLKSLHFSQTTKPSKSAGPSFEKAGNNLRISTEFHKHVCKVAWKHLACVDKPSIPHIEIEMKFGIIADKRTHHRIVPYNKPFIVQNRNGRLISNVSEKTFSNFQELLHLKSNNISKRLRTVKQVQTHTKDSIYNCNNVSKVAKLTSWRCSENLRDKEVKLTFIKKIRVKDFLIRYPQSSLDAKISISLEVPEYEKSAAFRNHSILQRVKNRYSYSFNDKVPLHLDLTKVTTTRRGSSRQSTTHEVEVEMDPIFKQTIFANDKEKFNEYMCLFLNTSDLIRKAAERNNMETA